MSAPRRVDAGASRPPETPGRAQVARAATLQGRASHAGAGPAPRRPTRLLPALAVALGGLSVGGCDAPAPDGPRGRSGGDGLSAAADPGSSALLDRIVGAETTLAYRGWRTVSQGPRGESRETRLRLERSPSGPTRIAWEGGEGAGRRWTVAHRFPWVERPALLLRNYGIVRDPATAEPVAWRPAERIRIEPRRPGRPSLEILVDAETGLVLAESHRDAEGREWRSARFESIEYRDPGPTDGAAEALDDPGTGGRAPTGLRPAAVTAVPEGFERVDAAMSACGAWREDFSDGLAALSVLQRAASPDTPPAGEVRRRSWLGGAALTARVGEVEATVTGTLPSDELLAVLRGLRPASGAGR